MITRLKQCETSIVLPPRSPAGFKLDWDELFASLRICGDRSSLAFEHSMMFTPFDLPLPRSMHSHNLQCWPSLREPSLAWSFCYFEG